MKYLCFGYYDKGKFDGMTESERNAMFDTCFEYDDHLRASGHWAGGEALQGPETALTLYWKNGKVATTDGPYAETKEQLGGILVLEARDMNQAVQLMMQHPAMTYGNIFEIRPAGDMNEIMKASEQRRRQNTARCRRLLSIFSVRGDYRMNDREDEPDVRIQHFLKRYARRTPATERRTRKDGLRPKVPFSGGKQC